MTDLSRSKTYDPSDPEQVAEREKQLKIRALAQERFIREALATQGGRAFFRDLIAHCRVFSGGFPADAAAMGFELGQRNVGLKIWADLEKAAPAEMLTMLTEQVNG